MEDTPMEQCSFLLLDLQPFLAPPVQEALQALVKDFFSSKPSTFEDLHSAALQEKSLHDLFCQLLANSAQPRFPVQSVLSLAELLHEAAYASKVRFMRAVDSSPHPETLLYDVGHTEDQILQRYKQLSQCFHPELSVLPEHVPLRDRLLRLTSDLSNELLGKVREDWTRASGDFKRHSESARAAQRLGEDYNSAMNGAWSKLRVLQRDELAHLSREELSRKRSEQWRQSYDEYKKARRLADLHQDLSEQVEVRLKIALLLHNLPKQPFEAQLSALSAYHLTVRSPGWLTEEKKRRANQILLKVTRNTDDQLTKVRSMEMIRVEMKQEKEFLYCQEKIKKEKSSAQNQQVVGASTVVAGVVGGVALGGLLTVAGGVTLVGLVLGGAMLISDGKDKSQESEKCEALNKMIKEAMKFYEESDYAQFIKVLSKPFEAQDRFLDLEKPPKEIANYIIEIMLKYRFKPDGIAYLLNLIGEVIGSMAVDINRSQIEMQCLALGILEGAKHDLLIASAVDLDEKITGIRRNLKRNKNTLHLDEQYPFLVRLEEMRHIANLNILLIRILNNDIEDFEKLKQIVAEVKEYFSNRTPYFSESSTRMDMLKDFLWVHCEFLDIEEEYPSQNKLNSLVNLNTINSSKVPARVELGRTVFENVMHYVKNAESGNNIIDWKEAHRVCSAALKLCPKNVQIGLKNAQCLIKLTQYTEALEFLHNNQHLASQWDYWLYSSIASAKKLNYQTAEEYIVEILKVDASACNNPQVKKQVQFLKNIKKRKKPTQYQLPEDKKYYHETWTKEKKFYKILSVDGGGIRGILPSLWLTEIEKGVKRPISHIFNMVAGTSTGAIIAAGLSIPKSTNPPNYLPKHTAYDLLDLYTTKPKEIFTDASWKTSPANLVAPRYSDKGRKTLFSNYFGSLKLYDSLTDIIIPAVYEDDLSQSYIFSNFKDATASFYDTLMATTAAPTFFKPHEIDGKGVFVDGGLHLNNPSLMAFDTACGQYNLCNDEIYMLSMGTGSFVHSSLNMTGWKNQGLAFWGGYLDSVVLPAQEGNTDRLMRGMLKNNYIRFQTQLETDLKLDGHSVCEVNYLLEVGKQYLEELYEGDNNVINNLIEFLSNN